MAFTSLENELPFIIINWQNYMCAKYFFYNKNSF